MTIIGTNRIDVLSRLGQRVKPNPGEVYLQTIFHDDCCEVFRGETCNCDPYVLVRTADGEVVFDDRPR
jgi:hypothetical protein